MCDYLREKPVRWPGHMVLLLAVLAAAFFMATGTAYAVPALPGSGHTGADAACHSHVGDLVTLDQIRGTKAQNGAGRIPGMQVDTMKDIPLVIIVIGFQNMPYDNSYDWGEQIFRQERSLQAYYSDMSFGQFTFVPVRETSAYGVSENTNLADRVNDGVVHVSLNRNHQDWIDLDSFPQVEGFVDALTEAIYKADSAVHFSGYDTNHDGTITTDELALGFVVAGYEASATTDYSRGRNTFLWSHAWSLSSAIFENGLQRLVPAPDGTIVSDYIAIAESVGTDENGTPEQEPISVLAHELGHYLGLPDLYDTVYSDDDVWSDYSVGYMSVMDIGSWGYDPDGNYTPYSMDVWSRTMLGWLEPVVADRSGTYPVTSQNYASRTERYTAVKIPTQHSNEYYLLENRQYAKWDEGMKNQFDPENPDGGILVWHIDNDIYDTYIDSNEVNNTDHHPAVMPFFMEYDGETPTWKGSWPDLSRPFFDRKLWQADYASLGTTLNLQLYGDNPYLDLPSERIASDIGLEFLTDSGSSMSVRLDTDAHWHVMTYVGLQSACEGPGMLAHWTCDYCGKCFTDALGQEEIAEADLVIPQTGHDWGEWKVTTSATLLNDGEETRICRNDPSHVETRVIPRETSCPMTAFQDLLLDGWYHDGVHWALEEGVMKGVGDATFRPDGKTSRAMLVTMLWRMEGEPDPGTDREVFADVEEGSYYENAVYWARENGIVNGYDEVIFAPDESITREQLAAILFRYAAYRGADVSGVDALSFTGFTDVMTISAYALNPMKWCVHREIVNGTGNGRLSPQDSATRAQVATMLMRYSRLTAGV